MPTNSDKNQKSLFWLDFDKEMRKRIPHLLSVLDSPNDFRELRIKVRDDGTFLAIVKGNDASGGPVVCFGSGYDAILCIMAVDAAIQGDNWRYDKPWSIKQKEMGK